MYASYYIFLFSTLCSSKQPSIYEPLSISRDPSSSNYLRAYLISKEQTTTKPSQGYLGAFFSWSSRCTIFSYSLPSTVIKATMKLPNSTTPVLLLHSDVSNVARVDSGHHLPDWSYPPCNRDHLPCPPMLWQQSRSKLINQDLLAVNTCVQALFICMPYSVALRDPPGVRYMRYGISFKSLVVVDFCFLPLIQCMRPQ